MVERPVINDNTNNDLNIVPKFSHMTTALRNIAFVGGIHGVGKSTVCKVACNEACVTYLSASDVIKWDEINGASGNKQVENISHTQDRLVQGLKSIINTRATYLLDGHYCLLNAEGQIENVPFETFISINPFLLLLIVEDVSVIKNRLETRDDKMYNWDLLNKMQDREIAYAKEVSNILKVKLIIDTSDNVSDIIKTLKNIAK